MLDRRVTKQPALFVALLVPALMELLLGLLFLDVVEHRESLVQTLTFRTQHVCIALVTSPGSRGPHLGLRMIVREIAAVIDQRRSNMNIGSESPRIQLFRVQVEGRLGHRRLSLLHRHFTPSGLVLDRVLLDRARQGKLVDLTLNL